MKPLSDSQQKIELGWQEQAIDDGSTIVSVQLDPEEPTHAMLFMIELRQENDVLTVNGWIRHDGTMCVRPVGANVISLATREDEDEDDVMRLARALRRVRLLAATMISVWSGS